MNYQIVIYAICKNELQHIEKGLQSYQEANLIVIIDTGSTDGTFETLLNYQKTMPQLYIEQKEGNPFDFGAAKEYALQKARFLNKSLNTIYCCFDLDEFLQPDGLNYIRNHGSPEYDMAEILANVPADNGQCYVSHKVHSDNVKWHGIRPIHEILLLDHINESLNIQKMPISYIHDQDKNKTRDYLSLLIHHLEKEPTNVLSLRYAISEYTVQNKTDEARFWLEKLESIPKEQRGINGEPEEPYYTNWRYLYHIYLTNDIINKKHYAQLLFNNMETTQEGFEFYIEKIYEGVDDNIKIELLWKALQQNRLQQDWTDDFIYLELTLIYWRNNQHIKAALCAMNAFKADPTNETLSFNVRECAISPDIIKNIEEKIWIGFKKN